MVRSPCELRAVSGFWIYISDSANDRVVASGSRFGDPFEESPGSMGTLPGNAWAQMSASSFATDSATENTPPTPVVELSRARLPVGQG